MAIAADLLAAYAATDFVVFDGQEQWDPRGRVLAPDANAARHDALVRLLEQRGLRFLYGEGRDPGGQ